MAPKQSEKQMMSLESEKSYHLLQTHLTQGYQSTNYKSFAWDQCFFATVELNMIKTLNTWPGMKLI